MASTSTQHVAFAPVPVSKRPGQVRCPSIYNRAVQRALLDAQPHPSRFFRLRPRGSRRGLRSASLQVLPILGWRSRHCNQGTTQDTTDDDDSPIDQSRGCAAGTPVYTRGRVGTCQIYIDAPRAVRQQWRAERVHRPVQYIAAEQDCSVRGNGWYRRSADCDLGLCRRCGDFWLRSPSGNSSDNSSGPSSDSNTEGNVITPPSSSGSGQDHAAGNSQGSAQDNGWHYTAVIEGRNSRGEDGDDDEHVEDVDATRYDIITPNDPSPVWWVAFPSRPRQP